jgi:cardiolipin synthase
VAHVERGFADSWQRCGGSGLPAEEIPAASSIPIAGRVPLRVIATVPGQAPMFRLDQLIAASARETLWLTDAYFAGTTAYVHALCTAARDGVYVRLLVPGGSDIPVLRPVSQAGYRPLLEAGVRVFEWNGTMLHAKTAVADHRWARVGSTNLNVASWLGNLELDVAVEDEDFAHRVEEEYVEDLARSTEVVLSHRRIRRSIVPERQAPGRKRHGGRARRAATGALRLGNALGAAFTGRRPLGAAESGYLILLGLLLVFVAAAGFQWPRAIAVPVVVLAGWQGLALLARALRMRWTRKRTRSGASR